MLLISFLTPVLGESRPLDLIALYQPASKITFKHGKEDKKQKHKNNTNEAEVKEEVKKPENINVDVHPSEPWKLVRYGFMGLLWGLMADGTWLEQCAASNINTSF